MKILLGFSIAIFGILIVTSIRSLTTFFHEMGHAIPALFFSKGDVSVYIGTYGDVSKGTRFRLGRLQIFFRWNLFDWKLGMCSFEPQQETWKAFLILLGGPIASMVISIPILLFIMNNDLSEITIFLLSVFMFAAVIDFVVNISPFSRPIYMHDGSVSYCDGYQLLSLIIRAFSSKEYKALEKLFLDKKYQEVIDQAEIRIKEKPKEIVSYYLAIEACVVTQQFNDALWFYEQLKDQQKLRPFDYRKIASFYTKLDRKEDALQCINHCIELQPEHFELFSERGRILFLLGQYELALQDINTALYDTYEDNSLIILKGMTLIHLGNDTEGLSLLQKAEQTGDTSLELVDFLVSYYQEKGMDKQAQLYQLKRNKIPKTSC